MLAQGCCPCWGQRGRLFLVPRADCCGHEENGEPSSPPPARPACRLCPALCHQLCARQTPELSAAEAYCAFARPQIFPAYDKRTCWLGEVHGGTGPTLMGASAPRRKQQPDSSDERGAGEEPAAEQRRRLQFVEEGGSQQQQQQAQQAEQAAYKFEYEKNPDKYLTFVSGGAPSLGSGCS